MTFLAWMAVVGALLLLIALTSAFIRSLPITTSAIYLCIGMLLGPVGVGLAAIDFIEFKEWWEHLTEIAIIISLFVGGLKLRLPFGDPAWRAAFLLAGPVMVVCIIALAAAIHLLLDIPLPVAFLLGAILAPTDPVLASTVSVDDAADRDRMRYGLSGEAGFNDGAAFPFVIFALLWMEFGEIGSWVGQWAVHRLVWAIPAGSLLGYFLGRSVGRLAIWLRSRYRDTEAPNDFLGLALVALAYVGAESIGAWGFLAAFGAGLGFRRAEIKISRENPSAELAAASAALPVINDPNGERLPAEALVASGLIEDDLENPTIAGGVVVAEVLSFGDTAERLLEVTMVVLVGVSVGTYWDWRAVPVALALFFVIRPAAVYLFLFRSPTGKYQRAMMAWFGIRGLGSLYYLSYALNHGLRSNAGDAIGITISVVALSILLHGITSQPALELYERLAIRSKNDIA